MSDNNEEYWLHNDGTMVPVGSLSKEELCTILRDILREQRTNETKILTALQNLDYTISNISVLFNDLDKISGNGQSSDHSSAITSTSYDDIEEAFKRAGAGPDTSRNM